MTRRCARCKTPNRVPASHLADTGRCGKCKAALQPLSTPIEVGVKQFDEVIKDAKVPVLVDFWAPWCGPCRMAAPIVTNVAKHKAGEAVILKVNTQTHPALAARYQVSAIPSFAVFKDGQLVQQRAGLVGEREMTQWLESA